MDNDKIITARIEDKLEQCERGSYITATGFLNMHEQSLAMRIVKGRSDVKSFSMADMMMQRDGLSCSFRTDTQILSRKR